MNCHEVGGDRAGTASDLRRPCTPLVLASERGCFDWPLPAWCDHPVSRSRRLAPALCAGSLLLGLGLAGCTPAQPTDSAPDAAASLAAALRQGRFATVPLVPGQSAKQARGAWRAITAGLDVGAKLQTTVTRVRESPNGRTAEATLATTYRLAGADRPWVVRSATTLRHGRDDRWRVRFDPSLLAPTLVAGERLVQRTTPAKRADIVGSGGTRLVTDRPVLRFGIDKTQGTTAQQLASARRLARLVGVDVPGFVTAVKRAGPEQFVEAIVLRTADAGQRLLRSAGGLNAVGVVADTLPLAPTREFARPLLGTVGPVTAEIVKASQGFYRAGDDAGLSGLEARYDEQLRGTPGVAVDVVPAKGPPREVFSTAPVRGEPLRLTLDRRLQSVAERALAGVGPASAVVAIRPSTGDLLAVASGPGSNGYSTATVGQYAPGSTFKVVSSLALLRAGKTPGSSVSCPTSVVVNGKRFTNYSDYPPGANGQITLTQAVANSCNTAFVGQRNTVSQADLAQAAAALGLGVDHDLGFPVYLGSVPGSETRTGHAASMIGQAQVQASPLAMAVVAASVKRGATVVPRLVTGVKAPASGASKPVTRTEGAKLRTLMRAVVTQGSGSLLAGLPGPPALAKTGTAEFGDRTPLQTHAWMLGIHGDLAVAVFVDLGDSGSGTAGPILAQVLRQAGRS